MFHFSQAGASFGVILVLVLVLVLVMWWFALGVLSTIK